MDFRAIAVAWMVGISIVVGALYISTTKRGGDEYAGIGPGTRVPLREDFPKAPRDTAIDRQDSNPADR